MKRRDLINRLEKAGLKFERHGTDHDIYSKDGKTKMIPNLFSHKQQDGGKEHESSISDNTYT